MGMFNNPLGYAGYPPGVTGTPTTQNSTVRAATAAEAAAGTLTNTYISPATADSATALDFASPPVLGFGSTIPRPVHATTLDSTLNTLLATTAAATAVAIANVAPTGARTGDYHGGDSAQNDTVTWFGGAPSAGTQSFTTFGGVATGGTQSVGFFTGNSAGGTQTFNVLTGSRAGTLNLATGAAAHTTKIGSSSGLLGFYGATAIVKPISTTDLRTALINLGLYTTGGASPLDLNGGTLTAATVAGTTVNSTTVNATTVTTNVAAAQLSLSATTIAATGSDTDVSLNLTTKGTGSLVFSQSKAGVDQNMQITNSDNTAAAGNAGLQLAVGGSTSTGDPYVSFQISGVGASTMTMGLDNSASDLFVISNSTALGTSNALTLTQAGALTATTTLTATAGAITATDGNFVSSAAGKGLSFNANTATGAASGPVVLNSRAGQVIFTSVSIAAAADLTLTITNSEVTASTTQVIYSMSGATTGSAPSIKSVTNSAGSSAIVVTNGTGATTTTTDITLNFIVVN